MLSETGVSSFTGIYVRDGMPRKGAEIAGSAAAVTHGDSARADGDAAPMAAAEVPGGDGDAPAASSAGGVTDAGRA